MKFPKEEKYYFRYAITFGHVVEQELYAGTAYISTEWYHCLLRESSDCSSSVYVEIIPACSVCLVG